MSDPLRTQAVPAADALAGRERDARVEELLLAGLDQYFAGAYGQAIHIWTRVLFLDRGHARARAYIERARSAEAERDRESDELLDQGREAFEAGQPGTARQLLTAAVERGASLEVALGYLGRLDRLDPPAAHAIETPAATPAPAASRTSASARRGLSWPNLVLVAAAALTITCTIWYAASVMDLLHSWRDPASLAVLPAEPGVPVPDATDLAVGRARRLFESGHAQDALRELAAIDAAGPDRQQADRLLAEIQQQLLDRAVAEDVP